MPFKTHIWINCLELIYNPFIVVMKGCYYMADFWIWAWLNRWMYVLDMYWTCMNDNAFILVGLNLNYKRSFISCTVKCNTYTHTLISLTLRVINVSADTGKLRWQTASQTTRCIYYMYVFRHFQKLIREHSFKRAVRKLTA